MSVLAQLSRELAALVARAAPAVVGLSHRQGQGSGLVLADDGYILTNSHVARSPGGLRVRLADGTTIPGRLVGADDNTDLAVVRVEARLPAPLALAEAEPLSVGQLVVAIGNPLGFERSVSLGVVSALFRSLPTSAGGLLEGLIQTDAAVNPGNSGGPLVDAEGRAVGITTAMLAYASGIGFAVPASTASWVAAVLIQKGAVERPFLGITARGEDLGPGLASQTGQPRAVRVLGVGAGTPAAASGLREDDVLLSANGRRVATVDDLQRVMVLSGEPELQLGVRRGGEERQLVVRPSARPRAA
ncbi:MAG: peptidase S1 [Acidobacteria bacterium]|nr:MAG: peptidase S1 [Acidobacteriota bacterium]PYQ19480.1 MAG: peptidase S1 [Acidobacteriota bacterium]